MTTPAEVLERAADPFAEGLFGGSPRMATTASETSTDATTAAESRAALPISSLDRARKSFYEQRTETPLSHGAEVSTAKIAKPALSAPCSETRDRTGRRSLSNRLTASLITSGLICGITPSSIRHQSGQPIRVFAFSWPGGNDAGPQSADSSCSSDSHASRAALAKAKGQGGAG